MQNKISKLSKLAVITALGATMIGCGGGSGGNPAVNLDQGVFRDANVDGLSYSTSSGISDTTNNGGLFDYQTGDVITFSIGDITLGTATAMPTITPVDLVQDGNINSNRVVKISQLLQSLDINADTSNGITIHPDVAVAMVNDGTAPEVGAVIDALNDDTVAEISIVAGGVLTNLLDNIVRVADNANSNTYAVVTAGSATAHVSETLQCTYSGGYMGNPAVYTENGNSFQDHVGVLINADFTGTLVLFNDEDDIVETQTFSVSDTDLTTTFDVGSATATLTLTTVDSISVFVDDAQGGTETFALTRIDGSNNVAYRFTGAYTSASDTDDHGLFTVDIDGSPTAVTGQYYSVRDDELGDLTGSVNGTTLTVTYTTGGNPGTATATIDLTNPSISNGTWNTGGSSSESGGFTGSGCLLNTTNPPLPAATVDDSTDTSSGSDGDSSGGGSSSSVASTLYDVSYSCSATGGGSSFGNTFLEIFDDETCSSSSNTCMVNSNNYSFTISSFGENIDFVINRGADDVPTSDNSTATQVGHTCSVESITED